MTADALAGGMGHLFAELYSQLHRMARREAFRAGPKPGMSATTLPHEAYSTSRVAMR